VRLEELRRDLVLGFRSLRASPGYSLVVVLTVGLGIAATTTTVSFMSPYLIRELPFEDPARLVQIGQIDPVAGWDSARFSLPMFRDWEERSRSFEELGTYYYTTKNVTGAEGPERIVAGVLSQNLFRVLGVEAELGRTFELKDEGVVVLGYGLWQRRYGGDPAILGRAMILDGAPHVVIGVMPRDFNFPFGGVKMWVPLSPESLAEPRDRDLHIPVGRLKAGVIAESARNELEGIQRELAAAYPDVDGRFSRGLCVVLRQLDFFDVDDVRIGAIAFRVELQFLDFLERDRVKLAERARKAVGQAPAPLLEHGHRIDVAQPIAGRLIRESLMALETGTFSRQIVAEDLLAAHEEDDGLIIDDVGAVDCRHRNALDGRSVEPILTRYVYVRGLCVPEVRQRYGNEEAGHHSGRIQMRHGAPRRGWMYAPL